MSENSTYAYELQSITMYKFGALISGIKTIPDKKNSIDISLQVQEVNIYESIFSPYIRCELAVVDEVGLLFNFPISGEEAIEITYKNISDDTIKTLYFVVDNITDLTAADDARSMGYIIKCVSLESYANNKQTIQQAYHDTVPNIVKTIFDQHIDQKIREVFTGYTPPTLVVENNDVEAYTIVIPNLHPFAAFAMLGEMAGETVNRFTYLLYQTTDSYNFRTLQGLIIDNRASKNKALKNKYVYYSNQITDPASKMRNEGRMVSRLVLNNRLASFNKLSMGYFHNTLFEINIAQKAVWGEHTRTDDIPTLYPNKLNTSVYAELAAVEGNDEQSNRTKYVVNTQKENDVQYPVSKLADKWGKDLIASNAMAQIDLTITVPGTSQFSVGELLYLEVPEFHGFNEVNEDTLLSGYFLISEAKHILHQGGFHTTVFGLNRDSYNSSIDRESRFAE